MADDFLSDEDKALFRESMRHVTPLKDQKKRIKSPELESQKPLKSKFQQHQETKRIKEYYLSDTLIDTVLSETILAYAHSSLTKQRFKDLKNGHIKWDARLDLHGLKSEEARERLCLFIQSKFQENKKCLLIIHGKGGHQGSPPVIKNLINRWLPQFEEVLAFNSALPKDGGSGSVYVLLKNNKISNATK